MHKVTPLIKNFLAERNLALSEQKTKIFHVENGFNFLGWYIYREQGKIFSVPSRASIDRLLTKITNRLSSGEFVIPVEQYFQICLLIEGWMSYYIKLAEKQSLYDVKSEVLSLLHNMGLDQCADMIRQSINQIFKYMKGR